MRKDAKVTMPRGKEAWEEVVGNPGHGWKKLHGTREVGEGMAGVVVSSLGTNMDVESRMERMSPYEGKMITSVKLTVRIDHVKQKPEKMVGKCSQHCCRPEKAQMAMGGSSLSSEAPLKGFSHTKHPCNESTA